MQKINIDRHATAQINMLANKLMLKSSLAYSQKFGIGITEWRVISVLSSVEQGSIQSISDTLGIDKAAISRCIKKLETKHYIAVNDHPQDRRSYLIHLTEAGQQLYDMVSDYAIAREKKLLSVLSAEEQDQLLKLLKMLRQSLEQM